MAHFAQLDENNKVIQVIVVHNNELVEDGLETEEKGISFCQSLFGPHTRWVQTSYNGTIRKNYASIGYTYDQSLDAFIHPQPYPSWILNTETCQWQSPVPFPADGNKHTWDEESQTWHNLQN